MTYCPYPPCPIHNCCVGHRSCSCPEIASPSAEAYRRRWLEERDASVALRAQLSAEQDKRSDVIRERNEAIEEARNATAANQILKAEVPRLEGEITRLAARSLPTAAEIANVIRCAFAGDRHVHDFDLAAQAVLVLLKGG